jgi:hypothetical protein
VSAQLSNWTIPEAGRTKESAEVVSQSPEDGTSLFTTIAVHGAEGRGDGPDSDPGRPRPILTDDYRTPLNRTACSADLERASAGNASVQEQVHEDRHVGALVGKIKSLRKPEPK